MRWCESPTFFCAASETARYVIDTLLHELNLPEKPFEENMIADQTENPRHSITAAVKCTNMVEVFVEDFISATNNPSLSHFRHLSR